MVATYSVTDVLHIVLTFESRPNVPITRPLLGSRIGRSVWRDVF